MIEVPYHPRYHENLDRYSKQYTLPCVICGKAASESPYYVILWGGMYLVTREESDQMGGDANEYYTGAYPIGTDCKRQHPEIAAYVYRKE